MWCASTRAAALAVLLVCGCGPHKLEVSLVVDATQCALMVPAGGSILYEVQANGTIALDGGGGSFCGGCLAVSTPINSVNDLLAFLRAQAPNCGGVHPGTLLRIRISGWSSGGCSSANPPNFCAEGPSVLVPDGTSDGTVTMHVVCMPACSSVCVPTTCMLSGKNCGTISDGCNMVLDCGSCKPPLRCGATTPNVCGR